VVEEGVDVVIASDPQGVSHEMGGWLLSLCTGGAALGVFGQRISVANVVRDSEFVAARLDGNVFVVSCYVSPRPDIAHFKDFLQSLEDCIRNRSAGTEVVVAGDFNARSAAWGDWETNARGNELTAFVDSLGLAIMNEGTNPTFTGRGAGSIVDITIVSEALAQGIKRWTVECDTENGSDHRTISFCMEHGTDQTQSIAQNRKWKTRCGVDMELMATGLLLARWTSPIAPDLADANAAAEDFEAVVTEAANFACPKLVRNKRAAVHWWTDEIAELRRICCTCRRYVKRLAAVTRHAGTHETPALTAALSALKDARTGLRRAIKQSKARCWSEMLDQVDSDPWGKPYKVVLRKLSGPQPTLNMERESLTRIADGLFPCRPVIAREDFSIEVNSPPLTLEEFWLAVHRIRAKNKSPGPDGIDTAILYAVSNVCPEWLLGIFNRCLAAGVYPKRWKVARLVLLRKGDKPVGVPSSYRPLCLLNDVGKLFEYLLAQRVEQQLDRAGGLSPVQYGFRRGRSTTDSAMLLKNKACDAINNKRMCVAVSLDIRNAFNTIGWEHVLAALRRLGIQPCLLKLFSSYFSDRTAVIDCSASASYRLTVDVTCGVPQGSVIGPLLWNIAYDRVLRVQLPRGVELIGFADDTLVVACGNTSTEVEEMTNSALSIVSSEIKSLELSLATDKTEAIMFRLKYKDTIPRLQLENNPVTAKRAIRYLGILIDDSLRFSEHVQITADKAHRILQALSRLMPNIGGPKEARRRLLASVIHSVMLYGAPVWGPSLNYSKQRIEKLQWVQRRVALRCICAYRTTSNVAANIISRLPPIELLVKERAEAYWALKNATNLDIEVPGKTVL